MPEQQPSRGERRKLRTRRALIEAAQEIYAERGDFEVSIQQITDAADVGFGTFYNHFSSKAELLDAAIAEALETHAAWLERLLADVDDPAVVFATSMRLTGRLVRTRPRLAQVMMNSRGALLEAPYGHAVHARNDIEAAIAAGRFVIDDVRVALACTAGCLIATMHLCATDPKASVDDIADQTVLNVLRMFGVAESEARRIVALPLPTDEPPPESI
ncbi:TetR/AcrR family transcriptional regulator [Nonomuraea turcica]|uniref:TetR/AcrR family transcriptional regulator n=1 Tax=Nonomuraea sp. G32 TaxID=3067274 RepID=UPI00273C39E3|nr:TetR/AcrR family transcriptional regulator [Nonomuraea sp. G32]MDP4502611.1 TetR/AcrR family transcriptional regulator [Nonomuraea sp. G32]